MIAIREIEPGDVEACARILYDAFGDIHDQHRFPRGSWFPCVLY